MFKLSLGRLHILVERHFAGIAIGRLQLWWTRLDGLNCNRVPAHQAGTGFD